MRRVKKSKYRSICSVLSSLSGSWMTIVSVHQSSFSVIYSYRGPHLEMLILAYIEVICKCLDKHDYYIPLVYHNEITVYVWCLWYLKETCILHQINNKWIHLTKNCTLPLLTCENTSCLVVLLSLAHICQTQGPRAEFGLSGIVMCSLYPVLQPERGGAPFRHLRILPSAPASWCHL